MIKVSTTGMAVSLKTDLRFPISGQWGHGDRIIQKTGKNNYVTLNCNATAALRAYFNERHPTEHEFIFTKATCRRQPINRVQAYRIVRTAAEKTVQDEHISCHSLRKTFGYHAWKNGTPPALLMDVYNHSSYKVTQHYLGIEQDERDEIYMNLEL